MSLIEIAEKFREQIAKRKLNFSTAPSKSSSAAFRKLLERSAKNLSIFSYEDEFKEYLKKETGLSEEDILVEIDKLEDLQIFSGKDLKTIQSEIDEALENNEQQNKYDTIDGILSIMFEDDSVKDVIDLDKDGELNNEEIMQYLKTTSANDGNAEDLSINDILISIKGISEGLSPQEIAQQEEINNVDNETVGTPLKKQNTHASNYAEPSGELVSYSKENDLNDINEKIAQANNQIIEKNNQKALINAQDIEYVEMISNLDNTISSINSKESSVAALESDLHTIEYDIIATSAQLENLHDPIIFTEQQSETDKLREELEKQKTKLEEDKINKQEKLKQEQQELDELNSQKDSIENSIEAYEAQHPSDEIDKINQEIEELNKTIEKYEADKKQIQEELDKQRETELQDAEVFGKASAYRQSELVKVMMDYATASSTKEYYDKWYFENINGKAYCAIFTTNVVELMYSQAAQKLGLSEDMLKTMMAGSGDQNNSSQGLTGLQFACASDTWGEKVQPALDLAGINVQSTIDITNMSEQERKDAVRNGDIYPGMVFTYKRADGSYHTGFIESINKDLSWNTIEGNTTVKYSDGTSESHTIGAHKRDATLQDLSAVNDPTPKILYWLKIMGYSDNEINSLIYS